MRYICIHYLLVARFFLMVVSLGLTFLGPAVTLVARTRAPGLRGPVALWFAVAGRGRCFNSIETPTGQIVRLATAQSINWLPRCTACAMPLAKT
jgi:hypothetical protein